MLGSEHWGPAASTGLAVSPRASGAFPARCHQAPVLPLRAAACRVLAGVIAPSRLCFFPWSRSEASLAAPAWPSPPEADKSVVSRAKPWCQQPVQRFAVLRPAPLTALLPALPGCLPPDPLSSGLARCPLAELAARNSWPELFVRELRQSREELGVCCLVDKCSALPGPEGAGGIRAMEGLPQTCPVPCCHPVLGLKCIAVPSLSSPWPLPFPALLG